MPTAVREPRLVVFNRPLATALGLDPDALDGPDGAAIFAGNAVPDGGRPIAQAYAGHQFGYFTALGDGRAILLGEQVSQDRRRRLFHKSLDPACLIDYGYAVFVRNIRRVPRYRGHSDDSLVPVVELDQRLQIEVEH